MKLSSPLETQGTSDLLRSVIEWVTELLEVDAAEIYLYDPEQGALRCAITHGFTRAYVGVVLRPGEGVAGRAFQKQEPFLIEDYAAWESRISFFLDSLKGSLLGGVPWAVLGIPLCWRGSAIGVLTIVSNMGRHRLTPHDVRLATLVANLVAVAIENARLHENLEASALRLRNTLQQEATERMAALTRKAAQIEIGARTGGTVALQGIDDLLTQVMELKVAGKVLDELSSIRPEASALGSLTPRETEVLTLVARGRSNKEIARELNITWKTAKAHVGNILSKLGLSDRTQAALYGARQGLVSPGATSSPSGESTE